MPPIGDAAFSQGDVMRRLRDLERRLDEVTAGRRLENASIGEGGIRVKGEGLIRSDTFDGNLLADNPGTSGWALGSDSLVLRGQYVVPVEFASDGASAIGFTVTTTQTARVSTFIDVPPDWIDDNFQALILAIGSTSFQNTSGVTNQGHARVVIDGLGGGEQHTFFPAGGWDNVQCSAQRTVTNPPAVIPIDLEVWSTGADFGSSGANIATVDTICTFRKLT